jgi:hypothetical protein
VSKHNENTENVKQNIILQQNYFPFDNQCYIQNKGLAMGTPTSAILAKTNLQIIEHNQTYNLLTKHKISVDFRYVDILIISDEKITMINIMTKLNTLHTHNIIYNREQGKQKTKLP